MLLLRIKKLEVQMQQNVLSILWIFLFSKAIALDQIRKVDFPFSESPEEYYQIALKNKEIRVSQQTGQIVSEAHYPFVALASRLSWKLHTGEGNVFWSIVLLLASASILFFMYPVLR